jgi:hypothetical protein
MATSPNISRTSGIDPLIHFVQIGREALRRAMEGGAPEVTFSLPRREAEATLNVLDRLAAAQAEELTLEQAVLFLHISQARLVRMVEEGAIPHREEGGVKLLPRKALEVAREQIIQERREFVAELTRESQEMGLYD